MIIQYPKLTFKAKLNQRTITNYIVMHHADATSCTIEKIHSWHLGKGWTGVGYHFFISKKGEIFHGRPLSTVGAHVAEHNWESIGICHEGDYEKVDMVMPPEQLNASLWLINHIREELHMPNLPVMGHRDKNKTACPGKYFPLEYIQRRI